MTNEDTTVKHAQTSEFTTQPPVTGADGEQLIALLERQVHLVNQLAALAKHQAAHVSSGDAEGLLELLGRRQELIDLVMSVQREAAPLAARLTRSALSPSQRDRAESLMNEIKSGLTGVMEQDDADRRTIQSARESVKVELENLGQVRQARHAYSPRGSSDPRFADRQG